MKKLIGGLLMVLCMAIAVPVQAQLRLGVKGGVNLSQADFSNVGDNFKKDNFTGFFIGPMAEFTLPGVGLGVDASLLFAQRGVKVSNGESSTTLKQNGFDIPVNLKYTIGLGSMLGVYLAAGPDFYFDFSKDKRVYDTDVDKKKREVGINVGAGLKLFRHLQVGANYNIPLGDTAKLKDGGEEFGSYKTKTWQVSVAYMF